MGNDAAAGRDGEPTSVELVRRAHGGDGQALEQLFRRYLPILRRWASGRLPGWARDLVDTDDMIQETLTRTLRGMNAFEPRHDGALAAYLRQILDNRIRDELRNAKRRPRGDEIRDDHVASVTSPLEAAIGSEAFALYEAALSRLSEEDRALVLTRIELGLSFDEVARATNKPTADAARMAVRRALVRLATEMDHE